MAFNEAQVVGTELEKVLTKVEKTFESDDMFWGAIKKRNVEIMSYRQMRVPLELRTGGSFGYFDPDGGDLGRGSGPTYDKATLQPVFMDIAIEYTKLAQWATDDQRKAVINGVRRLTAGATVELRRQLDAQLQQPGTGVVGEVGAFSTAGNVDTIDLTADGFGARLVRFAQEIQIFDSTLATNRGMSTIVFYDVENKQIKISPAIAGLSVGDLLVVKGIASPASVPALYGVPYHHSNASTGTWLGFNRATTPEIRSNRVNAAGNPLTLPLPRLAINKIGNRIGIENNVRPVAWMHPCQKQAYEEIGQLVSVIHKQPKEEGLNLYFNDNMQMAGAPVRDHFNWNMTRIDFVAESMWGRGEILPIGFYQTDGRKIFEIRSSSGGLNTADIFYMVIGAQTFVNNPAGTSYIDDLDVPAGY